ncbi:DUF3833 family protein [Sphingomonas sp. PB2P19]|uniref:DUF3833 family protein n=1 Tax=Sphingomonas rhamnosi TaxID=3096156 RepID=UPI002FCB7076
MHPQFPVLPGSRRILRIGARRWFGIIALSTSVGACVPSGQLAQHQAAVPAFDPVTFFAGATEGRGSLKILTKHRQPVMVRGQGVVTPDGGIVLDQDVRRDGAAPTHRIWHLRRVAPDRYAGTLTDATGPVTGEVSGNRLHLRFATRGGLRADQWLYLQPGGQIARNRMVIRKFGIAIASLDETITRVAP